MPENRKGIFLLKQVDERMYIVQNMPKKLSIVRERIWPTSPNCRSTGRPKNLAHFVLYAFTSSNIDRFSNLFRCQNQKNICNNTVSTDPITPQVCRYTTL